MPVLPYIVRALPAAHAHNLPQQAYEIKKIRKFILRVFWIIIQKLAPTKISHYTVHVMRIRRMLITYVKLDHMLYSIKLLFFY